MGVDADVVVPFAEQLQWQLSKGRAEQLLRNTSDAAGLEGEPRVPVPTYINLFREGGRSDATRYPQEDGSSSPSRRLPQSLGSSLRDASQQATLPPTYQDWPQDRQKQRQMLQQQKVPSEGM